MALTELLEKVGLKKETSQYEHLTEEELKRAFLQKVQAVWEVLPRYPKGTESTHYCEVAGINWKKVNKNFIRFFPEAFFEITDKTRLEFKTYCCEQTNSGQIKLNFQEYSQRRFKLEFAFFNNSSFFAFSETNLFRKPLKILKGNELATLAGYEPSEKKVLELSCMATDFMQNILDGRLKARIYPNI